MSHTYLSKEEVHHALDLGAITKTEEAELLTLLSWCEQRNKKRVVIDHGVLKHHILYS